MKNFGTSNPQWLNGEIVETTGPLSYRIKLSVGTEVRRHVDHIRLDKSATEEVTEDSEVYDDVSIEQESPAELPVPAIPSASAEAIASPVLHCSTRTKKAPTRYGPLIGQ